MPGTEKEWAGLAALDDEPSPKSQFHDVGPLAEVSENCTNSPTVTLVELTVKDASGASPAAVTLMVAWAVLDPLLLDAVSVTTNVPARSNAWLTVVPLALPPHSPFFGNVKMS